LGVLWGVFWGFFFSFFFFFFFFFFFLLFLSPPFPATIPLLPRLARSFTSTVPLHSRERFPSLLTLAQGDPSFKSPRLKMTGIFSRPPSEQVSPTERLLDPVSPSQFLKERPPMLRPPEVFQLIKGFYPPVLPAPFFFSLAVVSCRQRPFDALKRSSCPPPLQFPTLHSFSPTTTLRFTPLTPFSPSSSLRAT